MGMSVYWFVVVYCAVQRLLELRQSARNQAVLKDSGFHRADSRVSYFFMVAVHTAWFVGLILEPLSRGTNELASGWQFFTLLFVAAQCLRLWALMTLGNRWNVNVMVASDFAGRQCVTSGPYRFIRHPNYLAVIIEFFSLPMVGGAMVTALCGSLANALVLAVRIPAEEKELFCDAAYQNHFGKRARFIPCLF